MQLSAVVTRNIRKIMSVNPSRLFIDIHIYMAGPGGRAVSGRSPAEIVVSNPARGIDVRLL